MRVLPSPQIPKPLTAFLAGVIAQRNTHGTINRKFQMYGAPGDPPDGNKEDKCLQWLDRAALDPGCDASVLLGGLLHDIMEPEMLSAYYSVSDFDTKLKESIETQLARHGFAYVIGGQLTRGGMTASPTKTLQDVLRQGDFPGVDAESGERSTVSKRILRPHLPRPARSSKLCSRSSSTTTVFRCRQGNRSARYGPLSVSTSTSIPVRRMTMTFARSSKGWPRSLMASAPSERTLDRRMVAMGERRTASRLDTVALRFTPHTPSLSSSSRHGSNGRSRVRRWPDEPGGMM